MPKDNKKPTKKTSAPPTKPPTAAPQAPPPAKFVEPPVAAQPEHLCPKCQRSCKTLTMRVTMCHKFAPKL
jgi:hypothetical protein